jgi:formate/nitrite transporter FocA (FNT family)
MGFEHSIANGFFLPYAMMLAPVGALPVESIARNLVAATLGNIVGGTLLVAGVYWVAYLRKGRG